jgi:hypothetical protein
MRLSKNGRRIIVVFLALAAMPATVPLSPTHGDRWHARRDWIAAACTVSVADLDGATLEPKTPVQGDPIQLGAVLEAPLAVPR